MDAGTAWQDTATDMAFKRGQELYEGMWRELAKPGLIRNAEAPWMLASVDALVLESEGGLDTGQWVPLEIKTSRGYEGFGTEGTDEIPRDYWCQVAWQAMVVGSDHGFLGVLLPNHQVRLYEVRFDSDWDWMRRVAEEFRAEHLIPENPPMVEGTSEELHVMKRVQLLDPETVINADDELSSLIAELKHLRSTIRDYGELANKCEVRIREKMRDAKTAVDANGNPLLVRNVVNRKGYSVEPGSFETLVLKKPKEVKEL
jgi:predicted phage-related endonuclease